jgi:hypothetical protein
MTQKNINIDLIKNKKITIATPMSGGVAFAGYIKSIIELSKICMSNDIKIEYTFMYNESLITRGRNNLVHMFLKSDHDYLFFIDADISFDAFDFLYMVQLAELDKEKQIICGLYPKKHINWNFIKKAEEKKLIKNKEDYSKYQSDFVVNYLLPNDKKEGDLFSFNPDEPLEVYQAGTGFMLIARDVFYKFKKNYPEQIYIDEDDLEEKVAFFDCKINSKTKAYMSEDWMFCDYTRKILIPTWVLPWISLNHFGIYEYLGNFKEYSINHKGVKS